MRQPGGAGVKRGTVSVIRVVLCRPLGRLFLADDSGTPRPTVLFHGGYDSALEENYLALAAGALRRGYNVIAFDGPGQGSTVREQGLHFRPDWEAVVTPVVDFALIDDLVRATEAYTMAGIADHITCPTLVLEAENDQFFQGQPQRLFDELTCQKELISFREDEGAGEHCHEGALSLFHQRTFDWLDTLLTG
ncbi:alpha/beta hydrolase [Streptomyces sp. NPDC056669]|uniref:alpha/beta hydrolase n=1 Tax=Streptomyces sp. NPDC056669 TaxID=3345903 RepID=UPI0036C2AD6E